MNLNTPPHENMENNNPINSNFENKKVESAPAQNKVVCPYCSNLTDFNLNCSVCGAQLQNNQSPPPQFTQPIHQQQHIPPQNYNINPYQNQNYNSFPYYSNQYQSGPAPYNMYGVGMQKPQNVPTWVIISIIVLFITSIIGVMMSFSANNKIKDLQSEYNSQNTYDDYNTWGDDEYENPSDYEDYGSEDYDDGGLASFNNVDLIAYDPDIIELENGEKYIIYSLTFSSYSSNLQTFTPEDFELMADGSDVAIKPTTDKDSELGVITMKNLALAAYDDAYKKIIAFRVDETMTIADFTMNKDGTQILLRTDSFI